MAPTAGRVTGPAPPRLHGARGEAAEANLPAGSAAAAAAGKGGAAFQLWFDGGSRGNPGHAGAGASLCREDGVEVWAGRVYLGPRSTNNEAE